MNVDELAECALNPKTRILRQMKMSDVVAAKKAAKAEAVSDELEDGQEVVAEDEVATDEVVAE